MLGHEKEKEKDLLQCDTHTLRKQQTTLENKKQKKKKLTNKEEGGNRWKGGDADS